MPVAVSARGDVTLELESDLHQQAIVSGMEDVLAGIRAFFAGATRIIVRVASTNGPIADSAPRRLTEEAVKEQRLSLLRKRDPALDAAVDALDLELLE